MRWKAKEEIFLLVLVPDPVDSWIILCDHDKMLRHLFWAVLAFVSRRALSPSCRRPSWPPSTLGHPLSGINSVAAGH